MGILSFILTEAGSNIIAIVVSVGISLAVWLVADARSKARVAFIDEEFSKLQRIHAQSQSEFHRTVGEMQIKLGKSEQDRAEIHKQIERIDNVKASKEVVDGFKNEMHILRADMDKRFDRLERLLENQQQK
jgi:hypothetical protein